MQVRPFPRRDPVGLLQPVRPAVLLPLWLRRPPSFSSSARPLLLPLLRTAGAAVVAGWGVLK